MFQNILPLISNETVLTYRMTSFCTEETPSEVMRRK